MKYFIDFEYYNKPVYRISSVGVVDENGKEFYSLVHQSIDEINKDYCKNKRIPEEDFLAAPSLNDVFVSLYHWINHCQDVEMFCYGTGDFNFVGTSLNEELSFEANCMLSFLKQKMNDFSETVSDYFHTYNPIALIKVISYFRGKETKQNHNALEDAKLLKEAYENIHNVEPPDNNPFAEKSYIGLPRGGNRLIASSENKKYCFHNYTKAARFFTHKVKSNVTEERYAKLIEKTIKRIKAAIDNHTTYMGLFWKIESIP